MAGFDTIELETGYAVWMRGAHAVLGLLAMTAILASGTSPPLAAAAVAGLTASFATAAWRMHRSADTGRLHLCGGRALLNTADGKRCQATLRPDAWASRWFCLLRLRSVPDGRPLRRVVCRCHNHPDDYRRLLVRLRLGTAERSAPVWLA